MDDRKSERFGRYQILSELGRGAMGVVYKARDPKINRIVAVKTISLAGQSPEDEREYRERFLREAEAAGRLSHPGIVTIFDAGEEPETHAPYIVMEFVGGQSLDKLLSRDDHKLPVETALQLTCELAEALDCAHGQGVVHRDLKPANILLTEDGHAKIADFGVAKLNLSNQTLVGRALGTPAYMSPEQLNGEAVDGRSDLFSLGVVLYTMLTGHRPFQGNSAVTVSFKVVNRDPIPATLLDTELPQGLDSIIARAIAKDPAERYQRGLEMMLDIEHLLEGRKAKLPGSSASASTGQTAQEKGRSSVFGQLGVPAKPQSSTHALSPGHVSAGDVSAKDLLQKIRKKSYAGVLVLAGLFILGLWVISLGSQGVRPRAAGLLPPSREVAPVKTVSTPITPAASAVASLATAPAPTVEKLSKPVVKRQPSPPPTKVARAISPTVSAAASPVPSPAALPDTPPATLEIEVDHSFAEASLSVWVDGSLAYTHALAGADKKRLVVFHHVQGHEMHVMQIAPGKHRLRVQVTSAGDAGAPAGSANYDESASVVGDFVSRQESLLRVNCKKRGEINLSLQ
jgi:serine/threonine-protein kinase